jgi:purine-nucleoside phosphorylase
VSTGEGTLDARAEEAAAFLRGRGFDGRFGCALVLGTGLGAIADALERTVALPYAGIPHVPGGSGMSGHARRLLAGEIEGRRVLVLQGRVHAYEGDAAAMRVPIGIVRALGAPPLLLTNAAGSLDPELAPGSLVAIADHINLAGPNPLAGEPTDARFVAMTDAYDPGLRERLRRAAAAAGIALREGVYAWFLGPSFETPAEIRMARMLGADLVGMSTAPEVILARFFGLRVAAVSIVTNWGAGIGGASPSHAETKAVAAAAAADVTRLLRRFLAGLDHD